MSITYQNFEATEWTSAYIQRNNENGSVSLIPTDPANSDYQAYLASLEAPQG